MPPSTIHSPIRSRTYSAVWIIGSSATMPIAATLPPAASRISPSASR